MGDEIGTQHLNAIKEHPDIEDNIRTSDTYYRGMISWETDNISRRPIIQL